MKSRISILVILVIGISIFLSTCRKDRKKDDYRKKYVGKYQVVEKVNCYGPCYTCNYQRDTIIMVSIGYSDSTLQVLGREVSLDSDGNYYAYHYRLRLWNDSIYSYFMNGGLGCGRQEIYEGRKMP